MEIIGFLTPLGMFSSKTQKSFSPLEEVFPPNAHVRRRPAISNRRKCRNRFPPRNFFPPRSARGRIVPPSQGGSRGWEIDQNVQVSCVLGDLSMWLVGWTSVFDR